MKMEDFAKGNGYFDYFGMTSYRKKDFNGRK